MPTQDIVKAHGELMDKAIGHLKSEYAHVRTGRASASLLEHINIDYYGQATPITQVATIKTPEAHMLTIEPWDKGQTKAIEKAITDSDLGVTPSSDGTMIRLSFPQPTEERRKELVKQAKAMAEEAKVSIRNIRQDANKKVAALVKEEDLPEDEQKRCEKQVQDLTDAHIKTIEDTFAAKDKEIMTI
jgi:ribosome recycling factor